MRHPGNFLKKCIYTTHKLYYMHIKKNAWKGPSRTKYTTLKWQLIAAVNIHMGCTGVAYRTSVECHFEVEKQSSSPLKTDVSLCQSNHVRRNSPKQYPSHPGEMKRELVRAGALSKARADRVICTIAGWPLLRTQLPKKRGKLGVVDGSKK